MYNVNTQEIFLSHILSFILLQNIDNNINKNDVISFLKQYFKNNSNSYDQQITTYFYQLKLNVAKNDPYIFDDSGSEPDYD